MSIRTGRKFIVAIVVLLVLTVSLTATADAGVVKVKNKTNQTIVVHCSGQSVSILSKAIVTVQSSWMTCNEMKSQIAKGNLVVVN